MNRELHFFWHSECSKVKMKRTSAHCKINVNECELSFEQILQEKLPVNIKNTCP